MLELIPWRERGQLSTFHRDMDRIFDGFFEGWPFGLARENGGWLPSMDVSETSKELIVQAEIPGMDPKQIDISLHDNLLTIRGERKQEHEEKDENFRRIERRYGAFCRSIRLHSEVDSDKVKATYKKGVLKITLPKSEEESVKKIEVKAA